MSNPETPLMKRISRDVSMRWQPIGLVYRINTGSGTPPNGNFPIKFAPEGWPDLVLLIRGRFAGLEVKTEKGAPEPSQLDKARSWWLAGIPYFFVRSSQDVFKAVEKHFPEEVWKDPVPEEIARFRDAMSDRDNPGRWLKAQGYL